MQISNRVGLHSETCKCSHSEMSIPTSNTLTFGKHHKMGGEQVGCWGIGITNRKLAIIFQSRVVILNPFLLVIRWSFVWQKKGVTRDWKSGVLFTCWIFFLCKNKVYLHEKLSSLHKTHQTHKPRLIAGNSIIQTISLSNNENRTYSRDWPNCFLGGRRKVELQMVWMILQPWTLEIITRTTHRSVTLKEETPCCLLTSF